MSNELQSYSALTSVASISYPHPSPFEMLRLVWFQLRSLWDKAAFGKKADAAYSQTGAGHHAKALLEAERGRHWRNERQRNSCVLMRSKTCALRERQR